jgi:hypothetical protein
VKVARQMFLDAEEALAFLRRVERAFRLRRLLEVSLPLVFFEHHG